MCKFCLPLRHQISDFIKLIPYGISIDLWYSLILLFHLDKFRNMIILMEILLISIKISLISVVFSLFSKKKRINFINFNINFIVFYCDFIVISSFFFFFFSCRSISFRFSLYHLMISSNFLKWVKTNRLKGIVLFNVNHLTKKICNNIMI